MFYAQSTSAVISGWYKESNLLSKPDIKQTGKCDSNSSDFSILIWLLVLPSCDAWCPQMSVDILGTSWVQCVSTVQYSFTSTETRRLVRTDSPGRPPGLSHSSWTIQEGLIKQDYLSYHCPLYGRQACSSRKLFLLRRHAEEYWIHGWHSSITKEANLHDENTSPVLIGWYQKIWIMEISAQFWLARFVLWKYQHGSDWLIPTKSRYGNIKSVLIG